MPDPVLLGVPNFSEGRNERIVGSLSATLGIKATVLDTHFDREHNRCVITAAAPAAQLREALFAGACQAVELIDVSTHEGLHPRIGALDVCPVVWRNEEEHEAARQTALDLAQQIGEELELPVFLYGELASAEERWERAYFRRGGPEKLRERMESGQLDPDFGPSKPHPTAGATLVTARRPLVAFNLELDTPDHEVARKVAAKLREAGGGPKGVRAIGLPREGRGAQVSVNVHDPDKVSLAQVVNEVSRLAAEHGASPVEAELVGLTPEAAIAAYPDHVPIKGFDPARKVIEKRLDK